MTEKRPVICLPAIDWQYLLHRPQQLMLRFARAGHPVHYRNITQIPGTPTLTIEPNLYVYGDFDQLPKDLVKPIYIVYFPAHAAWLDKTDDNFIIYDCIDDDPVFDPYEEIMLGKADLVLGVSEKIMNKFKDKHPNLLFLPNGVDIEHYLAIGQPVPPEMNEIRAGAEAIIGFTGAFYQGWVDIDLLYKVAASRPRWQIVIIGSSYGWDFSGAPANISYLGTRSYQVLPSYIRCFDAGIIPFQDNRIARGADPVKLYEYLAAGLPVISRRLPFIEGLNPPLVYAYDTVPDCITAIEKALSEEKVHGETSRNLRADFVANFTWDSRIDLLLAEIRKYTCLEF